MQSVLPRWGESSPNAKGPWGASDTGDLSGRRQELEDALAPEIRKNQLDPMGCASWVTPVTSRLSMEFHDNWGFVDSAPHRTGAFADHEVQLHAEQVVGR